MRKIIIIFFFKKERAIKKCQPRQVGEAKSVYTVVLFAEPYFKTALVSISGR